LHLVWTAALAVATREHDIGGGIKASNVVVAGCLVDARTESATDESRICVRTYEDSTARTTS
jgi:hypothetical protein